MVSTVMSKWPRVAWPLAMLLGILALWLAVVFAGIACMLLPYVPSHRATKILVIAVPTAIFCIVVGLGLVGNYMAKRYPNQRGYGTPINPLKIIPAALLVAVGFGFAILLAALPTKWFAHTQANIPVKVVNLSGFRREFDYHTWIEFKPTPRLGDWFTDQFMWNRPDLEAQHIRPGDCIMLHAREWPLGIYVDSVTKSSACRGSSEADKRDGGN